MIVAIAEASASVVPVLEFRQAATTADAVTDYVNGYTPPRDPADYVGVDSGWSPGASELQSWWAVNGGTLVERLADIQQDIISDIKTHRDQRFASVVLAEYPTGSGNLFSCSMESQANWGNLATLDALGLVVYPFDVTTHDELVTVTLTGSGDMSAAVAAISTAVLTERSAAASAISAVLAATTAADAHAAAAGYLDS